jgi:DNA-binding Xre family transcriptional regulator
MYLFARSLEAQYMDVSYKKLWKLLIDRDMKKRELQTAAKLSSSTMSKLNHAQNIQMDV